MAKSVSKKSAKRSGKRSGSKKASKSKSKSSKKSKMAADMCYCVKCKKGVKPTGMKKETFANGRCAMKGTCSVCGTKVMKFCKC
jgi:hypothetical protein